jgi:hypothetical protein
MDYSLSEYRDQLSLKKESNFSRTIAANFLIVLLLPLSSIGSSSEPEPLFRMSQETAFPAGEWAASSAIIHLSFSSRTNTTVFTL